QPQTALVDGTVKPALPCPWYNVIKGDARSQSIAAASILAKVTRDRLMDDLAVQYPHYGWESNRGYGTQVHQQALATWGATPHHRISFAPVARILAACAFFLPWLSQQHITPISRLDGYKKGKSHEFVVPFVCLVGFSGPGGG